MSMVVSFLSGKGGSGKTTLALAIANLLSKCDTKTLLVDCDLSTNGATYFYESLLLNHKESNGPRPSSFSKLLVDCNLTDTITAFKIGTNLEFIPSVSGFAEKFIPENTKSNRVTPVLASFLDWARLNYDVILLDCQAGYTELLSALLSLVDVDLFVLETDSISAYAMRSLHLKIGNVLEHAKLYQVFNKATSEEFDIYSKIVGTFFTNIGTLMFDWKIRQAFSRSQIPDIEHTSAKYGYDLCEMCKIIFMGTSISEKLESFSSHL